MEEPNSDDNFWSRKRWLARLAFSFLIVGVFLAYTGYHGYQDHTLTRDRVILLYFAAMLSFVMFVIGVRARHR
ncbi:MAG TPA: hypothetical protein VFE47_14450 [Tepidisphaeraceae bacterium]|jgi:hypothetical protein|nr:hypothetical protein [Tepidisphaeraceae bacterium]